MDENTKTEISRLLDKAYESIKNFELNEVFRCNNRDFIRCVGVFVPGDLAIVYVKSKDGKNVEGAIILSDTFCGTRGNISDSEVAWALQYHDDVIIDTRL